MNNMKNRRESSYLMALDNNTVCDDVKDYLNINRDECGTMDFTDDVDSRDIENMSNIEHAKEDTEVTDENMDNKQTLFYYNNVQFVSQV